MPWFATPLFGRHETALLNSNSVEHAEKENDVQNDVENDDDEEVQTMKNQLEQQCEKDAMLLFLYMYFTITNPSQMKINCSLNERIDQTEEESQRRCLYFCSNDPMEKRNGKWY